MNFSLFFEHITDPTWFGTIFFFFAKKCLKGKECGKGKQMKTIFVLEESTKLLLQMFDSKVPKGFPLQMSQRAPNQCFRRQV